MTIQAILKIDKLGSQWETLDPFLVCAYHNDAYPKGNSELGPAAPLAGHNLGRDFVGKDGWRMYFGLTVPGFPSHPHRGFETVTVVRKGLIDHSDSLGASARFGEGDVQWLTAGRGIVHAEMFPLLNSDEPNPLELFQIWLNLPARHKMTDPHFTMFWSKDIPRHLSTDSRRGVTEVVCIAGSMTATARPPVPPPHSWASDPSADLAIWTIKMSPGAHWSLPPALASDTRRKLYFFKGTNLTINGQLVDQQSAIEVFSTSDVELINGTEPSELLMLQGRPIGEPVAQHGPFVMNSDEELRRAYADYHLTKFGDWSWPNNAPVHGANRKRFARHADGRVE
ncbi:MAG: pirin family protein [Collimonas sp.]|uniref:pirin family protein n=1 Tax=Collimonas sp. TaxID=1963772 RepID=UPI0032637841